MIFLNVADKTEELFTLVVDIGEAMLVNGSPVHRVEDALKRMCKKFGADRTDVFIITSSMVLSIYFSDGRNYTQTRRILSIGTDYEKVHKLNEISRKICNDEITAPQQIKSELTSIHNCKNYPFYVECLAYSVISGAFTLFFGGGMWDALCSLLVGVIVRIVLKFSEKIIPNKIFTKFLASLISTALAYISFKVGFINNIDKVLIGTIMTLIPGLGITTALQDLFIGDSIAAILRTIEVVLSALAIAAGYFAVAIIGGWVL